MLKYVLLMRHGKREAADSSNQLSRKLSEEGGERIARGNYEFRDLLAALSAVRSQDWIRRLGIHGG